MAEEALRASEERFRKQYKGFPLPTYSWLQVGDDFVLQDFNDAAEAVNDGDIRELGRKASLRVLRRSPEILADLQACVAEQHTLRREMRYHFRTHRAGARPGGHLRVRTAADRHGPHRGHHRSQAGRATARGDGAIGEAARAGPDGDRHRPRPQPVADARRQLQRPGPSGAGPGSARIWRRSRTC